MKEWILSRLTELHINLYYKNKYENTEDGNFEKIKDITRYEQLKEVVRNNPSWDVTEMSEELSERIRKRTSLNY